MNNHELLRKEAMISEQQHGLMLRTTDVMFALGILMQSYRRGLKELHCVCVRNCCTA